MYVKQSTSVNGYFTLEKNDHKLKQKLSDTKRLL